MKTSEKFEMKWLKSFNTSFFDIDNQHKKLFRLLADFANAYIMGFEKEVVTSLLFELEDYTKVHFKDEEALLTKHGKGASTEHLEKHKEFIETINNLKFDYVSEDKEISDELFNYLRCWLQQHILGIDTNELKKIQSK